MDFNLRKNGGRGSSYIFDMCSQSRFCRNVFPGNCSVDYWSKHLGTDALCTMWLMSVG